MKRKLKKFGQQIANPKKAEKRMGPQFANPKIPTFAEDPLI
jgi:hypothetical protein